MALFERPASDETLTMAPRPRSTMPGMTARARKNGPLRFTASTACQRSSAMPAIPSSPAVSPMPATLTSTSTAPSSRSVASAVAPTYAALRDVAAERPSAPPPSTMAATVSSAPSCSRSTTATAAPSAASRTAVALPMPLAEHLLRRACGLDICEIAPRWFEAKRGYASRASSCCRKSLHISASLHFQYSSHSLSRQSSKAFSCLLPPASCLLASAY